MDVVSVDRGKVVPLNKLPSPLEDVTLEHFIKFITMVWWTRRVKVLFNQHKETVMSKKSEFFATFVGQEIHVQTEGGHGHRGFVEKSDELKVTFLEKFEPSRDHGHNGKEIRMHVFVEDIVMVEITKTKPR